ncbi:hypothetical protein BTVI_56891 [Pitangus sulphuratus]|nr:hypothetical protein BTVI_56891 [Pitangus sulphuratus]
MCNLPSTVVQATGSSPWKAAFGETGGHSKCTESLFAHLLVIGQVELGRFECIWSRTKVLPGFCADPDQGSGNHQLLGCKSLPLLQECYPDLQSCARARYLLHWLALSLREALLCVGTELVLQCLCTVWSPGGDSNSPVQLLGKSLRTLMQTGCERFLDVAVKALCEPVEGSRAQKCQEAGPQRGKKCFAVECQRSRRKCRDSSSTLGAERELKSRLRKPKNKDIKTFGMA